MQLRTRTVGPVQQTVQQPVQAAAAAASDVTPSQHADTAVPQEAITSAAPPQQQLMQHVQGQTVAQASLIAEVTDMACSRNSSCLSHLAWLASFNTRRYPVGRPKHAVTDTIEGHTPRCPHVDQACGVQCAYLLHSATFPVTGGAAHGKADQCVIQGDPSTVQADLIQVTDMCPSYCHL